MEELEQNKKAEEKGARVPGSELYEWLRSSVSAVLIIVLTFTFAVRMMGVQGPSMRQTLQEGDRLLIEIRAIDQRAYDYLYSMQLMDNTGTNPIPNFTGGCLGYFSAYHQITYDCVFHVADAEEDD